MRSFFSKRCHGEWSVTDIQYRHKEERNKKSRAYYKEHAEEIREQKKEYNKKNIEQHREWQREYYKKNKEDIYDYQKEYRNNNRDTIKAYMKKYREDNEETLREKRKIHYEKYKDILLERSKKYVHKNIEKVRTYREQYRRKRVAEDPLYKLSVNIRHLISNSLRRQGYSKKTRTYQILGCDYNTFYEHLLKTFKDNYGVEWDGIEEVHIDHIIPVSTGKTEDEIIKLCHYKNLQLLKAKDNLEKKDKLDWKLKK